MLSPAYDSCVLCLQVLSSIQMVIEYLLLLLLPFKKKIVTLEFSWDLLFVFHFWAVRLTLMDLCFPQSLCGCVPE